MRCEQENMVKRLKYSKTAVELPWGLDPAYWVPQCMLAATLAAVVPARDRPGGAVMI